MALHDRPRLRRLIYATTFEAGGILLSTLLLLAMAETTAGKSLVFSVMASTIAMLWNLAFNAGFEAWETRQPVRGRSLARRSAHALLFEAGLVLFLLPLTMWWFVVPLIEALAYEAALILAFLVYTWIFTWAFDRLFGLPASAR
ncbi:PACE efflux transporter [Paragemmobacter ruber]|uniref:PACE efflux transporter n=1 Tax=Paragemmobacter ruber TaxID=1985673 RepID=A0ABW9Y7Z1_9RHOB|nr:PACE efflux transporter [Rhodobacter ruber]NBE08702.1 PACE efflux transporter [Rhodobacter ruber]